MSNPEVGRQLRALRTASGRTVASVAGQAGLSVPYIANLENGRGNPTLAALSQLAAALGMRLDVALVPADGDLAEPAAAAIPGSLVRLGRTDRFRQAAAVLAARAEADQGEFTRQLISALAALAAAIRRDPGEADWWRLIDALLLIAAYPGPGQGQPEPPGDGRLARNRAGARGPAGPGSRPAGRRQ
jgi:transcriptional regulator with XRE-family HTH domain